MDKQDNAKLHPDEARKRALTELVALRDELLELHARLEYLRLLLKLEGKHA